MYERGLQALQRRDFAAAADALRNVIERYPDERELEPKVPTPKTAAEWVYAGTVALNSGDEVTAMQHLQRALSEDPRHDHAHYMMTVASVRRRDLARAIEHLRQAIALNPENRSLARQDPDLDPLRQLPGYQAALETAAAAGAQPGPTSVRPRKIRR